MNRLNKFVIIMILYSLLCGQTLFVLAQDEPKEEKPAAKKQPSKTIWVGRGYDATGKYADTDSVRREPIFDIRQDAEGNLIMMSGEESFPIVVDNNTVTDFDEIKGKSLSEYQSDFSNKLKISGSYKLFSASLSVNFGISENNSTAKEFLTISHWVQTQTYTLPDEVKPLVRPEAQTFINEANPREVFRKFGTHFIWQANTGGRVDFNFIQNNSSSQRDFNFQAVASAAFNAAIASVSVENETAYRNSMKKINENGSVKIKTYGGGNDAGAKIYQNMSALSDWAASVENNPTLCRFTDQSLRGIWELASTDERKAEL